MPPAAVAEREEIAATPRPTTRAGRIPKPLPPVLGAVVRCVRRLTQAVSVQLFLWRDDQARPLHAKEGRCPAVVPARLLEAVRAAVMARNDRLLDDGTAVLVMHSRPGLRVALAVRDGEPLDDATRADLVQWLEDGLERQRLCEEASRDGLRFRDFARASGDWLWETNASHVCEWVSDNFKAQTGYDASRVIGRPALNSPLLDSLGQPLAQGGTLKHAMDRQEEVRAVCTMGRGERQRMIAISAVPKYGEDGRFEGFRGISRDVTDRIRLEQASRERDAAERANRSKSEFLSRVSHELRTPLNAILGLSQLLMERRGAGADPQEQSWLQAIHRSGQYLLAMVNELLDLGRIEQGLLRLTIQSFFIEDALTLAQTVARGDALQPDVTLHMHVAEHRTPVRADRVAVEQILVNLLSNAFKYNRPGGRIDVKVELRGQRVCVVVADTGVGIPKERQSALFVPFQRLGAENSRIAGSGLGLSIAHALAQKMEGSLEVQSEPGVGTLCTLSLPCGDRDHCRDEPAHTRGSGFDVLAERPLDLLYIEDDPVNQILLQEVVRALPGWSIRKADNALEGLGLLHQRRPDILLIDMNLPDGSGLQVLSAARSDPALQGLMCVALSADAMPDQVQAALDQGFDDYWTKPFGVRDLRRRLMSVGCRLAARG